MRHYLDHASTSWPKPPGVIEAGVSFQASCGAAAGRGGYRSSQEADRVVQSTRRLLQETIGAAHSDEIAFCTNGTHSLNAAIFGLALGSMGKPFHVVTTATEHNSVLRPLALAAKRGWLTWTAVECDPTGRVDPADVADAVRPETRWLFINHASNVTGYIQDIAAIREIADRHSIHLMIDAAQSLGYMPIDVRDSGIDILSAPGHKGLSGTLGTGLLYVRREIQSSLAPLLIGGTGELSETIDGDFSWQSVIESGNLNVPAIASLKCAMEWKQSSPGTDYSLWIQQLLDAINASSKFEVVGSQRRSLHSHVPIISVVARSRNSGLLSQELAMMMESMANVECRAGFHCAGLIHQSLNTTDCGGTLRLSMGQTSQADDVVAACEGIQRVAEIL